MIPYPPISPKDKRTKIPQDADKLLDEITDATMLRAWGERTRLQRRGIATAAIVFGEEFERRAPELAPNATEQEAQRFLMSLMSAAVEEFARREGISRDEAAAFLSEVGTRDRVLEFNEVLGVWAEEPERSLDGLLSEAVDTRRDKTVWARHFKSG